MSRTFALSSKSGFGAAVNAIIVFSVLLALCALLVFAGLQSEAPTAAYVLYGLIGVVFLVMVFRMLRLPEQSWVAVDAAAVSWRTSPKARNGATPTGSVPLSTIASIHSTLRQPRPWPAPTPRLADS